MDIRRRMLFKKKASSGGGSTAGGSYTVNLNGQWEATTAVPNPDSTLFDGVYRSVSNYNVNNGVATMYITIKDCSSFKMYIRSYAESNWDYVMVSQLDKTITGSSSYSDTTLVKAHTRGNQQSGTALSNYTLVEFTGITSGEHTITVVYRKDNSVNNGDDRGYVLIEKSQAGSGDSGGDDEGGSSEGPINTNYLTIEARENGLTASLSVNACEYCVDGDGNWKTLSAGASTESINTGHTLSFRGELTPTMSAGIGTFTISKKCNLKGNCMSMLFGDDAVNNFSLRSKNYAFCRLFYNCENIVNVSSNFLPATTLVGDCYQYMFYGCTSLTTAPSLPAITLSTYCYQSMFYGCTSLITAPSLPATTLASSCYGAMFYNCTSLKNAPYLPETTLSTYCYQSMFYGCTSLITAPSLPATTLQTGCYNSMFYGCTSLITAPLLPATTLAYGCYGSMFRDCTSLKNAPKLPATTLSNYCYQYMFYNCTSLKNAPKLPATTLGSSCYYYMFYGCTSLTTAPNILAATTLTNYCYQSMFEGCTSLVTAPELSATTLAKECCERMFYNCTSLTTAPSILPATTLTNRCYRDMFYNCTSLTAAPELPATTLANTCYSYMFQGCTSLKNAPELPATTLAESCYGGMFEGCTSLTTAPELPATTLENWCYSSMFSGCTKLNYIKMLATNISATGGLNKWVYNVSSTGTFVKNPAMTSLPTGVHGIPSGWTVVNDGEESIGEPINIDNYLTIEAREDGLTASLSTNSCEYCVDGDGNWKSVVTGTATESINAGQTLSFRGNLPQTTSGIGTFTISKKCNLKGNCMSMIFGDNAADNYSLEGKNYVFCKLFYNCTNVVNVSSNFLPATTLARECYREMFRGCTSLTTAPELPATTLAEYCCEYMFEGCTSLTTAPELPATTLERACYYYMFRGCTSLTTAPELPATTLERACYMGMFDDCTSLKTAPELPATTLTDGCYDGMFEGCTSLTTAPELPTTTLVNNCYRYMFYGCTNLTTAPELPATTLTEYCYQYMFYGCTKLNYIKMLATDISASWCLDSWVYNVSTTGTFVKNSTMNSLSTGTSGIPRGWTVVNDGPIVNTNNYLTIEALEDGLTASLSVNACEYCVDGDGNWKLLASGTETESINSGQTLSFRSELTPASSTGIGTFTISKKCNLKGNCMSMLFGDNAADNFSLKGKDYAFYKLFYICSNIINVSSNFLPATTLADSCYHNMFHSCYSLATVPELPATTLADNCYYYMFYRCYSLATAPELPATTLANRCYSYMFHSCTKLNYIKMLAVDISADSCLNIWVSSVSSTGTFVKNPAMNSLPTGTSGIPSGWTVVNDGEESGGNEITFYIDDQADVIPMTALSNMTWEEFVNSEYANQNSMLTNFRLDDYGSYNSIQFYHEEAMQDMTLYYDNIYHDDNVKDYDIIEDGKTYYAY